MLPHTHVHISRITCVEASINAPNNVNVIGHQTLVNIWKVFLDFAWSQPSSL
jgi:hypothetical protein